MKAAFIREAGGPEVLEVGELPNPKPKEGEALIRVHACGMNKADIFLRKYGQIEDDRPRIPGCEVSGTLVEIDGDTDLRVGDAVVVNPAIPCGECRLCRNGLPCQLVNIFGYDTQGGYAEFTVAPVGQIYAKPESLTFEEAAAFPLTYLTAWHMLVSRANLQAGENVLVWGGSGNLGSAGIAIAKFLDARVVATGRSEEAFEWLRMIGADEIINYEEEDVVDRVSEITDGEGVDAVFETVGAPTWERSLSSLSFGGRIVVAGTVDGGESTTQDISELYYRQQSILGARMGTEAEFRKLIETIRSGDIRPVFDRTFPLDEASQAQIRMENGEHLGKMVLICT